jgi:hypothetical protein
VYKCYIVCIDCRARGGLQESLEKAIDNWNGKSKETVKKQRQTTLSEIISMCN